MDDSDGRCFTVGVFQDVEWASRGLEALLSEGFSVDSFSMISRNTPEAEELLRPPRRATKVVGPAWKVQKSEQSAYYIVVAPLAFSTFLATAE